MSSNESSSGSFRVYQVCRCSWFNILACVLRGGCWYVDPAFARALNRFCYFPNHRGSDLGFRLVRIISALELIIEDCRAK